MACHIICFVSFRFVLFRFVSIRFVSIGFVSFRFVSFRFDLFRFVPFRFCFVSHFTGTLIRTLNPITYLGNNEYYSPGFDSYPQYSLLRREVAPDLCMSVHGSVYHRHTWLYTCPILSSQRIDHRLQEYEGHSETNAMLMISWQNGNSLPNWLLCFFKLFFLYMRKQLK